MSDTRTRFQTIADGFQARVAGTTDWSASSPCDGWTARDVAGHVIGNLRGIAARATGTEPEAFGPADDATSASAAAIARIVELLGDPAVAGATVNGPFGPMPFEQLVGRILCTDTLVHTWDLARATGQDETLDAFSVSMAFSGMKPLDGMIRNPGFFDAKVEAADTDSEQTQFLKFLGRRV